MRVRTRRLMVAAAATLTVAGLAAGPANAQVYKQEAISDGNCRGDITDVEYGSQARFWFVTSDGAICKKVNGVWTLTLKTPTLTVFNDIEFSGDVGLAAADAGILYRSVDAGNTWSQVTLPNVPNNSSCTNSGPVGDLKGAKFANPSVAFIFGGPSQILRSTDGGASFVNFNSYDSNGPTAGGEDCRYDGSVAGAFFVPGAAVSGYFTGSDYLRFLRNADNATPTSSGFEARRNDYPCFDDPCGYTGDPANPAQQFSTTGGTALYSTPDAWGTYRLAESKNGSRPNVVDVAFNNGTVVAAGPTGAIVNSIDLGKTQFKIAVPADVADVDFAAVSLADQNNAAVGGKRGVLLTTDNARFQPDVEAPTLSEIVFPRESFVGAPVTYTVTPSDTGGAGVDPAAVQWTYRLPGANEVERTFTGAALTVTPAQTGSITVSAKVFDRSGNESNRKSAFTSVRAFVPKVGEEKSFFFPTGTKAPTKATTKGKGRNKVSTINIKGRVGIPAGVAKSVACKGVITISIVDAKTKQLVVARKATISTKSCAYSKAVKFKRSKVKGKKVTIVLLYPGNTLVTQSQYKKTITLKG